MTKDERRAIRKWARQVEAQNKKIADLIDARPVGCSLDMEMTSRGVQACLDVSELILYPSMDISDDDRHRKTSHRRSEA